MHLDTGIEQFLDIHIPLRMPAARRVGMGQIVDEDDLRPAGQDRVEIHLLKPPALVIDRAAGNDLDAVEQGLGIPPPPRLDDADDDVHAVAAPRLGRGQHGEGLAGARSGTKQDFKTAAGARQRLMQQGVRRGPLVTVPLADHRAAPCA